jgi:hypothetical protein
LRFGYQGRDQADVGDDLPGVGIFGRGDHWGHATVAQACPSARRGRAAKPKALAKEIILQGKIATLLPLQERLEEKTRLIVGNNPKKNKTIERELPRKYQGARMFSKAKQKFLITPTISLVPILENFPMDSF